MGDLQKYRADPLDARSPTILFRCGFGIRSKPVRETTGGSVIGPESGPE